MSQTNAIILRFRQEEAQGFEEMFELEILPMWQEFKAQGKFLAASLTPVEGGSETKEGTRDYILHVEVPSMAEHEEFVAAIRGAGEPQVRFAEALAVQRILVGIDESSAQGREVRI